MPAPRSARERTELRLVVQRLAVTFARTHTHDAVRRVVEDVYRSFDDARVREFVPLLTERRAHRELAG